MQNIGKQITLFVALTAILSAAQIASLNPNGYWTGNTSVESHSMRVTLKSGYADVEEDATLRAINPNTSYYTITSTTPLELSGTLIMNPGTSVVGLYVWNGNEILKAKLKPTITATSQLSNPSANPVSGLDPVLLTRCGDNTYSLSIYPLVLNDARKVRVRYLVPFNATSGTASIPLTPAFSGNVDITVNGADYSSIITNRDGVRSSYDLPFTLANQAVTSFALELGNVNGASSLRTSFDAGDYQGKYWLLNQAIPDSVLDRAGMRREIVILWKWSFSEYFLTPNYALSSYGSQALSQARQIEKLIDQQSAASSRVFFGMVHQPRKDTVRQFPLGNRGSQRLLNLSAYLASIDESSLASMVPSPNTYQKASDQDIKNLKLQSQAGFDTLLAHSVALYSPASNVIKHLVILNAGPGVQIQTPGLDDIITAASLQGITVTLGNSASYSYNNAMSWFGVDLNSIASGHTYTGATTPTAQEYSSSPASVFSIPAEKSLHFSATVSINGASQIYELANAASSSLHFALHTVNVVDSSVNWRAFDDNGAQLSQYTQTINSLGASGDSGIAKLVGSDLNVVDQYYQATDLGAAFGVVRKDYALVALAADSIGTSASATYQNGGLPYLTTNEIYRPTPVTTLQQKAQLESLFSVRCLHGGKVQFTAQGELRTLVDKVEILNLQGKVIAVLNAPTLRGTGILEWDGSTFPHGLYFVHITAGSTSFNKQFLIQ